MRHRNVGRTPISTKSLNNMNVAVVGSGYVGLVSGVCFSEMGASVWCVDVDTVKIENLKKGVLPIFEEGLQEMVDKNLSDGRLHFTISLKDCLDKVDVVFIAVGTPPGEDGSADVSHVMEVASEFGKHIAKYTLLVMKSTVPVGTCFKVRETVEKELRARNVSVPFDIASNPEFLKEGVAIKDFMTPDRVVIGVESERARDMLASLYRPFLLNNYRVIFMDILSAEMTKYASNAMLATRISFMNEIAALCEFTGADVSKVRAGMASDSRIGSKFLYPGCGYGGSCFPKDVNALISMAGTYGYRMKVISAVEEVNNEQKKVVFRKLQEAFGGALKGCTVALWGLAFKPCTDDMREAPSIVTVSMLLEAGAEVRVFDPVAMPSARSVFGDSVVYCNDIYDVASGADAVALLTEWKQFRIPDWTRLRKVMRGNVFVDGRNIYNPVDLDRAGFEYYCVGRRHNGKTAL